MTVTEMITDFCTALPPEKRGRFDKGEYILQNIQVLPYSHIQLSSQQTRLIIDICVLSLHPLSQPRPQRHSEPIRIRLFNIHCWIFMSSMCNSRGVGLDRGSSVVKRWACKHENPSFNPGHVSSSDESKLKINSLWSIAIDRALDAPRLAVTGEKQESRLVAKAWNEKKVPDSNYDNEEGPPVSSPLHGVHYQPSWKQAVHLESYPCYGRLPCIFYIIVVQQIIELGGFWNYPAYAAKIVGIDQAITASIMTKGRTMLCK